MPPQFLAASQPVYDLLNLRPGRNLPNRLRKQQAQTFGCQFFLTLGSFARRVGPKFTLQPASRRDVTSAHPSVRSEHNSACVLRTKMAADEPRTERTRGVSGMCALRAFPACSGSTVRARLLGQIPQRMRRLSLPLLNLLSHLRDPSHPRLNLFLRLFRRPGSLPSRRAGIDPRFLPLLMHRWINPGGRRQV
jgi:hypothetical protein